MGTLQEFENNRLAGRAKVVVEVGEFTLTLDPKWMLFRVSRKDGQPIPKALEGTWTEVSQFREMAERVLGSAYSKATLLKIDEVKQAALKAGLAASSLSLSKPEEV